MRLFDQIFSKPHRIAGKPHFPTNYDGLGCWWSERDVLPLAAGRGFNVSLVGESQWQQEISAIVGGRCAEGHNCHFPAQLVFDDSQLDRAAVGVMIGGRAVGWLPHDLAPLVRQALGTLNPEGRPVMCKAKIVGGWDRGRKDRGYFGVRLSLALPLKPAKLKPERCPIGKLPGAPERVGGT
ncbi:hypothetical protein NED98_08090 [Sphingomonas sp. MMSM20]|uniref:hypothetical protein n=1 Tax=Sphingomonas lycopersici TaxID=2951807 RepID=UPI0022370E5B|nr:hypothetical protein [Sphingomonas lycopersici]MCW6530204.1 hypothetical protein [Sphingomonas lycopersici]